MKYGYQMQKFSQARQCLMLPHPMGEARSIAHAFDHCNHGLGELRDLEELDEDKRNSIQKLKGLMDTSGLNDPNGRGTWEVKAEKLTEAQRFELSRVIDDLADFFHREFWSNK